MRAPAGVPGRGPWVLAACILCACTHWPPPGSGGMAEQRQLGRPGCPVCLVPPNPTREELDSQLQLVRGHLDTLVLRGADACLPAHVLDARDRQTRIARALAGGLPLDAENDLIVQRDRLAVLEQRLNYIQANGACVTPAAASLSGGGGR